MSIEKDIKRMQSKYDETGILTVYLNTDVSDGEGSKWKLHLKNGLKDLKAYTKVSDDEESRILKKLLDKAEGMINDSQREMKKGLMLVESADEEISEMRFLQVPVGNEFHWEKQVSTSQLEQLRLRYPSAGLVVAQQTEILFIESALGEVKDEIRYIWDSENEDWVNYQKDAPSFAADTSEDKFERRFDENRYRWYKRLVPVITREIKNRSLDGIYIVGSKEVAGDLEDNFDSGHVKGTITKNLGNLPSHQILSEVYDAL